MTDLLPDNIPWTSGNYLKLHTGGNEFFPALIAAIDKAQHNVFLETYLYADDLTTAAITEALLRAGMRGVQVQVLVDGFGSRHFFRSLAQTFQGTGVRFLVYRPEHRSWKFRRSRLRRLHRKLAVVDHHIAFIGGINIIDDNNTPPGLSPRFDFAIEASGPIAQQVHHAALREWALVARSGFQSHLHHWRQHWTAEYRQLSHRLRQSLMVSTAQKQLTKPGQVRFLPRDNTRHRQTIANAYLSAIESAQQHIILAHVYFLPGFRFRHALREAALRGVQVTLLLQGTSDHPLLQYATQALYGNLLRAGIELHEFTGGFLHAKVGCIDGQWCTVGSSNIDPFSLSLAHEGNLEIRDSEFAGALEQRLKTAIEQQSRQITLEQLKHAGWWSRANRWLAYGLVQLLINFAGYGARRGMD
ncbi:MAG: cardiolipin synthase ClsB [Pseudomonadota bacterium]|jgi:cardiolipin synthase